MSGSNQISGVFYFLVHIGFLASSTEEACAVPDFSSPLVLEGIGKSIDLSGDTAVSACRSRVSVYQRFGRRWSKQTELWFPKFSPFDFAGGDFGDAFSVSGDTIAVGAPAADAFNSLGGGSHDGEVYLYRQEGHGWRLRQRLCVQKFAGFGTSVALDSDRLVVGGPYYDTGPHPDDNCNQGAAFVYIKDGTEYALEATLSDSFQPGGCVAIGPGKGHHFGFSVAISGDRIVVGSPLEDSAATGVGGDGFNGDAPDSGATFVFERGEAGWEQTAYLKQAASSAGKQFGESVAIAGDTIVVGDQDANYVFTFSGGTWEQRQTLPGGDVELSESLLSVRPPGCVTAPTEIYVLDAGSWVHHTTLEPSGGIAISGNTVVVGEADSSIVYEEMLGVIGRLFVDSQAPAGGDGTSWEQAFRLLQDALGVAALNPETIDQIWVAGGIYYADDGLGQDPDSPSSSFSMRPNLSIYGGFRGGETDLSERDPARSPTVLSGDIDQNDLNVDGNQIAEQAGDLVGTNSYHVVTALGGYTLLDGLTITSGAATGGGENENHGGGMRVNDAIVELASCRISGNLASGEGGGLYAVSSSILMNDSEVLGNHAAMDGGAMYLSGSYGRVELCRFAGNSALGDGGGIFCDESWALVVASLIAGNTAGVRGGGLFVQEDSDLRLSVVTIAGNSAAGEGGGLFCDASSNPGPTLYLHGSLIWGNAAAGGVEGASASINLRSASVVAAFSAIDYSLIQNEDPDDELYDGELWRWQLDGTDTPYEQIFLDPVSPEGLATLEGNYRLQERRVTHPSLSHHPTIPLLRLNGSVAIAGNIGAYSLPACEQPLDAGLDADADENHNGVPNLLEFLNGGRPAETGHPSGIPEVIRLGDRLYLVYYLWNPPGYDGNLEVSADLGETWQPFAERMVRLTDYRTGFIPDSVRPETSGCGQRVVYEILTGERLFFRRKFQPR